MRRDEIYLFLLFNGSERVKNQWKDEKLKPKTNSNWLLAGWLLYGVLASSGDCVCAVYCSRAPLKNWGHKTRKKKKIHTEKNNKNNNIISGYTTTLEFRMKRISSCCRSVRIAYSPFAATQSDSRFLCHVSREMKWDKWYVDIAMQSKKQMNQRQRGWKRWRRKKSQKTFTKWSNHHLPDTCGTCHPPAGCLHCQPNNTNTSAFYRLQLAVRLSILELLFRSNIENKLVNEIEIRVKIEFHCGNNCFRRGLRQKNRHTTHRSRSRRKMVRVSLFDRDRHNCACFGEYEMEMVFARRWKTIFLLPFARCQYSPHMLRDPRQIAPYDMSSEPPNELPHSRSLAIATYLGI